MRELISNSRFLGKLSNAKHNPKRFLDIFLPNNLGCTKFISSFSKLLQPKEYAFRRDLLNALPGAADADFEKIGYKILNLADDESMQAGIQRCLSLSSTYDYAEEAKKSKKSFLIMEKINLRDQANAAIVDLIANPKIIMNVANYLGMVPMVAYVALWYSPNISFETGRSQMYHFDGEDRRQVKCFIPLDIIDEDCGPLTVLPKDVSFDAYAKLKRQGLIKKNTEKVSDEVMYNVANENQSKQMTGAPGDVVLVDTCGCYHYGSRPAQKPRLLLHIQYYTPFSRQMPLAKKQSHPELFATKTANISSDIYKALFGYSYLHRR
jgi:hypothetical protein